MKNHTMVAKDLLNIYLLKLSSFDLRNFMLQYIDLL